MKLLAFLIAVIMLFAVKPASAIDWVMDDKKIVIVNQTKPLGDAETKAFNEIATISKYLPSVSYLYINNVAGGTFLELYKEKLKGTEAKIPEDLDKLLGIGVSEFNNTENQTEQFEQAVKDLIRSVARESKKARDTKTGYCK